MFALTFGLFMWSLLALGIARAVPARPLYEPPEAPKPPPTLSLSGTTWQGRLYADGERVTFHADGTLTYNIGQGRGGGSPGSWRLTGNQLYFEINKYSEYQTIVDGEVIKGNGWNKDGLKCQPFLKRILSEKTMEKGPW
jgi:hypothetical protein